MEITVTSKNCDVSDRVKQDAVEKIKHATRIFDRVLGVEMVFSEEHNPRIPEPALVEVTARTKGHHIRAQGAAEDHRGAVDIAVGRFERQLAKYKHRLIDRTQRRSRPQPTEVDGAAPSATSDEEPEGPRPRIVRRKTFELSPMVPEDAAWQLELLGHDFFLFTNAGSGRCSVIYRRRDGQLGLIEAAEPGETTDGS